MYDDVQTVDSAEWDNAIRKRKQRVHTELYDKLARMEIGQVLKIPDFDAVQRQVRRCLVSMGYMEDYPDYSFRTKRAGDDLLVKRVA